MTAWQHLLTWAVKLRRVGDAVGLALVPVALTFAALLAFRSERDTKAKRAGDLDR